MNDHTNKNFNNYTRIFFAFIILAMITTIVIFHSFTHLVN
jgi:hypothetical protein